MLSFISFATIVSNTGKIIFIVANYNNCGAARTIIVKIYDKVLSKIL